MRSPINEIRKNMLSISRFGGYNHTDTTAPGEWYEMLNISNRYFPLLAPRRSREQYCSLDNPVKNIIYKNQFFIYSTPDGKIYSRKKYIGSTPGIVSGSAYEDTLVHDSGLSEAYRFYEMGNKILCLVSNTAHSGYITFSGQTAVFHRSFEQIHLQAKAKDASNNIVEPLFYQLSNSATQGVYEGKIYGTVFAQGVGVTVQAIKTVNNIKAATENGYTNYDSQTEDFLNIGFRYVTEEDDGSYIIQNLAHLSTATEIANMTKSQYYIAEDKKLYRHDGESGADIEITAPKMAMFVRCGLLSSGERATLPSSGFNKGDYVTLNIGRSLNLSLPCAWEKKSDGADGSTETLKHKRGASFDGKLQVLNYHKYSALETESWHATQHWDGYFIFEYNAAFLNWIIKNNLVHDTEHFERKVDNNASYSLTGLNFVSTVVSTGSSAGVVWEAEATDVNLHPAGSEKFYPESILISKQIPNITAPVENNNRIWAANNYNNEIRASAQGNFENWDEYRGLVSDSYAVSVGSDGVFTASCVLNEAIYFFKENSFTIVYGTRPSNYCTQTVNDFIGIGSDGADSLQVIGSSAYYLGIDGRFYRFNGQNAVCISAALGDERYTVHSSAHSAEKYFALAENQGAKQILVYNTATGMWTKEDANYIERILNIRTNPCAMVQEIERVADSDINSTSLLLLDKWTVPKTENNGIEWLCESGLFGIENDFCQYITKLKITFESETGSEISVYAKYDNEESWNPIFREISKKKQTCTKSIALKRCQFVRLKIEGIGFSKIYRIGLVSSNGGEK